MGKLPPPWGAYLRLQSKLDSSARIDDHNWGLEAGLNSIIESAAAGLVPSDIDIKRSVASGARAVRHRQMLHGLYLGHDKPRFDPVPLLDARHRLRMVRSAVTAADWALLSAIGQGYGYEEIELGVSTAKLRVRVLRLRRHLAEAA